jgi:4-alpha-glucanotransferase
MDTLTFASIDGLGGRWHTERQAVPLVGPLVSVTAEEIMNALNRLAARYGIEESFRDAHGLIQTTTTATRLALLAAMGVKANTEEAALAALDALDREEWLQPLTSVHIAFKVDPLIVPITYPAGTETVTWRLTLEGGEERTGAVNFKSLPLLQQHNIDNASRERRSLNLAYALPFGYHRLSLTPGDAQSTLIVTPGQCWLPRDIEQGRRLWGVAAQLYLLKSSTNWGIGDFNDLRQLAQTLVSTGAQAIGLNPLHALFVNDPEHASPYSPASRLLLNVLNIDVPAVAEAFSCAAALRAIQGDEFQQALRVSRGSDMVDYTRVARLKVPVLKMIFDSWDGQFESAEWQRFRAFRRGAHASVERSCLFLALREHFATQTPPVADWRDWPAEFRSPESAAVDGFARDHMQLVTFQVWLQFLADTQLAAAAKAAAPMAIGLYRDLAVGADPSGAETWSNQQAVVQQARVGAPPDIYNPAGQDWGLPPFHPMALRKEGYRSFIDLLRANMCHAGGLRIDHVMALQQLYWIPQGSTAAQGAFVRYPREDLIGILALESHRNRCLVVGEDLGTVPEGFRERMSQAQILSYRVLFFEKDADAFIPPDRYPRLSLAVAGSHDLPTLMAWMSASDLVLKAKLGLYPNAELLKEAHLTRASDRQHLLAAFGELGLAADPAMSADQFATAAHAYLASSASAITLIQIDDITRETVPVNVPTTSTEHPNWRRRLSKSLEEIADDADFRALVRLLRESRS